MTEISKINTNNTVFEAKKVKNNKPEVKTENNAPKSQGVYPSGELMRSMIGIQTQKSNAPSSSDAKRKEINDFLHSLPITGQVMKVFGQDERGKEAINGLVDTLAKGNTESSNINLVIDLVESKKVHYSALLYLCNQGIMSDEYEKDLDLLYDTHKNQRDVKEAFVPTVKNTDDALLIRETGDVFQVDGEDNIYIKTSDTETKQLKMTRDTYLRLFPPLERFALYQGDAGNCYMLSCLDAMNSNPISRVKLLDCFEEDGDMLHVSLPDSDYVFTMPKNKMPSEIKDYREQYSMGAKGFKIIEHVYGKDVQTKLTEEAHDILKEQSQEAKGFFKRRMFKKQLTEFEKALAENPDNIIVDRSMSNQSVSWNDSIGVDWYKLDETTSRFKRASDYYRGKGGHEEWVFQRFGFKNTEKIFDLGTNNATRVQDMMFNPDNKDKYLFTAFSHGNGQDVGTEGLLDEDYGVYTKHSFSVKPKLDKNGNKVLHVSNPWNSTQSSVMSYEKFQELFTGLIVTEVES